jgi:hypothetical protein
MRTNLRSVIVYVVRDLPDLIMLTLNDFSLASAFSSSRGSRVRQAPRVQACKREACNHEWVQNYSQSRTSPGSSSASSTGTCAPQAVPAPFRCTSIFLLPHLGKNKARLTGET